MIDEFPILAVAATQAQGETIVRDAAELRVKETDRIATVVAELRKLGAQIEPYEDGLPCQDPPRCTGQRWRATAITAWRWPWLLPGWWPKARRQCATPSGLPIPFRALRSY